LLKFEFFHGVFRQAGMKSEWGGGGANAVAKRSCHSDFIF